MLEGSDLFCTEKLYTDDSNPCNLSKITKEIFGDDCSRKVDEAVIVTFELVVEAPSKIDSALAHRDQARGIIQLKIKC